MESGSVTAQLTTMDLPATHAAHAAHRDSKTAAGLEHKPAARKMVMWDAGQLYPLIPGRLYFTMHINDEMTVREINEKRHLFFCSTDLHERYVPFCADFGPVNMACIERFCREMNGRLSHPKLQKRPIVYYCSPDEDLVTNAAFLLGCYLVLERGYTPEEAVQPFTCFVNTPILDFRDATFTVADYHVNLLDCFRGILRAKEAGWLKDFDLEHYEKYTDPRNADHSRFCPKFIAFRGPIDHQEKENTTDLFAHEPSEFFEVFKQSGVTDIVRLNDPSTYDITAFEDAGFRVHDLYFDDCTTPSESIIENFLDIADQAKGTVAVHCLAGLGRTGTLIALWMMTRHGFHANECIGYLRIMRPGSVIGPQQHFLKYCEDVMWVGNRPLLDMQDLRGSSPGCRDTSSLTSALPPTPTDSVASTASTQRHSSTGGKKSQAPSHVDCDMRTSSSSSSLSSLSLSAPTRAPSSCTSSSRFNQSQERSAVMAKQVSDAVTRRALKLVGANMNA